MNRARVVGTGSALPGRRLTNADLEKMVQTSDEWIVERTGIHERRILEEGQAASDLAATACRRACEAANVPPTDVDCVIVGTVTADMTMPSCAALVAHKIGCRPGTPAFDVAAACAGFLYGLSVADAFVARGSYRHILVVGVEVLSRIIDWSDRSTCVLFGDGAGAALVTAESDGKRGLLSSHLHADGSLAKDLCIPAGGSAEPLTAQALAEKRNKVTMNGREVFRYAVKNLSAACEQALAHNHLTADDVNLVVAHQANLRIVEGVAARVGVPLERFFLNLSRYGNTSSASVPIALDEAVRQGKCKINDNVLMCAFGGGFAWGSAVMRW